MKHYYLFIPLLLAACHNPENKTAAANITADSIAAPVVPLPPEVIAYQHELEKLDTTDMKNTVVAADKFDEAFTGKDPALCDAAYIVFTDFYKKIFSSVEAQFGQDSTLDNSSCAGEQDTTLPAVQRTMAYAKTIRQYGFRIFCTEGTSFIDEEGDFFGKRFYKHVSKEMKAYLEQMNRENKSPFSEDAGIILSAEDYVERLAWWDTFIERNPEFRLLDAAKSQRKTYLTYFLQGMDNTRALSDDKQSLDPYFQDAYTYMGLHYPNTYSNKIVKPVLDAFKARDRGKARDIVLDYVRKGIIEFNEVY